MSTTPLTGLPVAGDVGSAVTAITAAQPWSGGEVAGPEALDGSEAAPCPARAVQPVAADAEPLLPAGVDVEAGCAWSFPAPVGSRWVQDSGSPSATTSAG